MTVEENGVMTTADLDSSRIGLTLAVVLDVTEEHCTTWPSEGQAETRFAVEFPRPRVERVSTGQLVALATMHDERTGIVWRWYDAVVVGENSPGRVRLWEPRHGALVATPFRH
jgi:hypothetical protein